MAERLQLSLEFLTDRLNRGLWVHWSFSQRKLFQVTKSEAAANGFFAGPHRGVINGTVAQIGV
ncbi:hypothetical protein KUV51_08950 [Tateyamaria omphalii]|uniref:hypothetical protein n=1 Tax=Tateyamaria omphalii TaxID=299262 RepID=UPI001C993D75|nr:hypothetical protein [Tateyamaria omphalii]MBY5933121.1 hypothetical protein [Tateyamaria omphalii]